MRGGWINWKLLFVTLRRIAGYDLDCHIHIAGINFNYFLLRHEIAICKRFVCIM